MKMAYCAALNEALVQEMERDPGVFLLGVGLGTRDHFFGSIQGIKDRFGAERVIDCPVAEETLTGLTMGAAVNGLVPVLHHIRVDFALLAINQLFNMIAPHAWAYQVPVPLVIRMVVGRGWGGGHQHSKSLHSLFAHMPGLKVIMPTTPRDAKGMLAAAIRDEGPVICIEHRWLYYAEGEVPEGEYIQEMGPGEVLREGSDLTVVATSWMNVEALHAADILARHHGVSVEVVDVKTAAPLEPRVMVKSAFKTGRVIVADNDWSFCGLGAELAAVIYESCFRKLKRPVARLGWSHTHCPTVGVLEDQFYRNAADIVKSAEAMLSLRPADLSGENFYSHTQKFRGPF